MATIISVTDTGEYFALLDGVLFKNATAAMTEANGWTVCRMERADFNNFYAAYCRKARLNPLDGSNAY